VHWLFDLEHPSWEEIIRRATSKLTSLNHRFGLPNLPASKRYDSMNLHFGTANTLKTLTR